MGPPAAEESSEAKGDFGYIGVILRLYWGSIRVILGLYWGYIGVLLGFYWGYMGLYWGYIGVLLGFYWGYMGIMEKKMETIMGHIGFTGVSYWFLGGIKGM